MARALLVRNHIQRGGESEPFPVPKCSFSPFRAFRVQIRSTPPALAKAHPSPRQGPECAVEHEADMWPADWSRVSASLTRSCHMHSVEWCNFVSHVAN